MTNGVKIEEEKIMTLHLDPALLAFLPPLHPSQGILQHHPPRLLLWLLEVLKLQIDQSDNRHRSYQQRWNMGLERYDPCRSVHSMVRISVALLISSGVAHSDPVQDIHEILVKISGVCILPVVNQTMILATTAAGPVVTKSTSSHLKDIPSLSIRNNGREWFVL